MVFCIVGVMGLSCDLFDKDNPSSGGDESVSQNSIVLGRVVDSYGYALADVKVSLSSASVTTNDEGWFTLAGVAPSSGAVVSFSRDGYNTTYRLVEIPQGATVYLNVTMISVGTTQMVTPASGGTVSLSGASVTFQPDSFVDSSGNPVNTDVEVSLTYFDPSDEASVKSFPGDFQGIDEFGNQVRFETYGFINVELSTPAGEQVQLSAGSSAEIVLPVPSNISNPPAEVPLWYYDLEDGLWHQSGTAVLDSAAWVYRGSVSHFSYWNVDMPYDTAYLSGRVITSDGIPVSSAEVRQEGIDYTGSSSVWTSTDGRFLLPVKANAYSKVWVQKGSTSSPPQNHYTPGPGETLDIGDILIDVVPQVQITLTWGEMPYDLDSHLVGPDSMGGTFHIYYSNMGSLSSEPYAWLDTDDTSSYGPEVITVTRLRPGTYAYCVHNFSGQDEKPIEESNAEVSFLDLRTARLYTFHVPSSNPDPVNLDVWHVFDFDVNANGDITDVRRVDEFEKAGDSPCVPAW